MNKRILFLTICLAVFIPGLALAKRKGPPAVDPVLADGVRFTAPNDDGKRAYVRAWDTKADKLLWEVTVFRNTINPSLEEDVQHVYITKLALRNAKLIVTAEDGREFSVDLKTRVVAKLEKPNPKKL